jgi:hypothetical protein
MAALEAQATEPPAGRTVMARTHANGNRKAIALLKNRLTEPGTVEDAVRSVLVLYLTEWARAYRQGVSETPSTVDRTILDIRRDTVVQILSEIGRPVSGSPDATGSAGDRPTDGVPPSDF